MIIKVNDKSYNVLHSFKIYPGDAQQEEYIAKIRKNTAITVIRNEQNYYICEEIEAVEFLEMKIKE